MNKVLLVLKMSVFLIVINATSVLANNYADTYGFSPKGMGMGNAMCAHVNDWSSVYYNIAGLGRTNHFKEGESVGELFLGYMTTLPQMDIDIPTRWRLDSEGDIEYLSTKGDEDLDFGSIIIGTAIDLNLLYKMPEVVSSARFGLGMSVNDDMSVVKIYDVEPQTHNFLRYGREIQRMVLIAGTGFGFWDDTFGVGFGVNSSFGGEGVVDLRGIDVRTAPQSPDGQAIMDLTFETTALVIGLYLNAGKVFHQLKGLDIGVSYRKESKLDIDPFDTLAEVDLGTIPLNLNLALFDYYQPDIITAGFSYKLGDKVVLSIDIEYQTWSEYEVSSRYDLNFGDILPDLDDIVIPKIGVQYQKNHSTELYFGYYFQPSFVPDKAVKGDVNWIDNDKHVLSIGMSYKTGQVGGFQSPMEISVGYQLQYLDERDIEKISPTNINPNYSVDGTCHTFMVGISF